jgi:hypothetical protein
MAFLSNFVRWSFLANDDEQELMVFSNFFDSVEPSEFYVELEINENRYRYELVATDRRVIRETIYNYDPKKKKYLERLENEITTKPKTETSLDSILLRNTTSVVSTLAQHKTDILKDIGEFFYRIYANVNYGGLRETPIDIKETAKYLHRNHDANKFVADFIRECDAGICDIQSMEITSAKGAPEFMPVFLHKVGDDRKVVHYYTESSGTKALYRMLPEFKRALDSGSLVIIDEIDVNIHPHLLPKLIGLFLSSDSNPKNAQLLFSTHDSQVLDLLGRYRTYLVNKEDNESYLYRLDEIPGDLLRNDRPVSPIYSEGRIGGVPKL